MNKKEKDLWLKAIDELIEYYSSYEDDDIIPEVYGFSRDGGDEDCDCPLCVVTEKLDPENLKCDVCPWVRFEGHTCLKRDEVGKRYSDYPVGVRLKRLNSWKRKIRRSND